MKRKIQANSHLKRAGLKNTLPRVNILNIFERSASRHLSAEEVYRILVESGEEANLGTVYRVLTQFEAAGLLVRHYFEERAVFELDDGVHHDHLVCLRCQKMLEFVDPEIEARQLKIAKERGFSMTDHCLYIYGVCSECQK